MRAHRIELTAQERQTLERWVRSPSAEQRQVSRARIVLHLAQGLEGKQVAAELGCRQASVSKWRRRFAEQRIAGLSDAPRSGKKPLYTAETERRVLAMLDESPPAGFARWNGPHLAQALVDVDVQYVWKVLRRHGISLERRRSWCVSTDPDFAAKAADVVGLYLHPPDNAVVLSVDEKPHIQALERAQGWLRLPNGKAVTGYGHEYKRHGTTTLFAALNIATGQVQAKHTQRRRRVDFLGFMNQVVAAHRTRQIHVILDNLNTHKPKHDHWLARHRNVHFHYTPTHASWLNQIEVWFSKLSRDALKGANFTSPAQVRGTIDSYIKVHNAQAKPFKWTKPIVTQTSLQPNYANLKS